MSLPSTPFDAVHTLDSAITVYQSGWWPLTSLHLSELEQFLRHGSPAGSASAERLTEYHQQLGSLELIRDLDQPDLLQLETETGLGLQVRADGLYILELAGQSLSRTAETLTEFEQKVWRPLLQTLFSEQLVHLPITADSVWPVWIDHSQPHLFELPASFGSILQQHSKEGVELILTSEYLFIIAPETAAELIQPTIEDWLSQQGLLAILHSLLTDSRAIAKQQQPHLQRTTVRQAQLKLLRRQLQQLKQTLEADQQLLNWLQTPVTHQSLGQVSAADQLIGNTDLPATYAHLTQTYAFLRQELMAFEQQLRMVQAVARQRQLRLLVFLLSLIAAGVGLEWIRVTAFSDLTLGWLGALLILIVVAVTLTGSLYFISQRWQYPLRAKPQTLPKSKSTNPKS